MTRIRKIAFEEHFTAEGFQHYAKSFMQHMDPASVACLASRLSDFDDIRLGEMNAAGVDIAVLSQSGPGVQGEEDPARAIAQASRNNDFLARQVERHPTRYRGFATLSMHDPAAAVAELERAVVGLGFKGCLVNGHTQGRYYDDRAYDVFWERLQELEVPMYLHPADPLVQPLACQGHPELAGAAWGWGVETGTHALRLLFGGVFDRFPGVTLILGHMGEGLPFQRWRLDSRFAVYSHGIALQRRPSEYIGTNIVITTSGVCSPGALAGAIAEMGPEAVMFSVDYPYESSLIAADFIEQAPLDDATRALVCHGNAERLFKL
ncbi:amidohydrolase family protein [Pigmentiphaga sp.]|uniref:amidohydrolase family protein n=1 Tax=Pigmentiphaga sp. TaxID=1977564 RepID=UPI00128CEBCE|nr:amidohydrolase family protein [Pigmentiphaga sp.]MPS26174.1 amidohydrolase [Alcaligenaceae bacterium SAGV5]MPS53209.1 amidohydrolase [Alcaligenaceae bacterium SAGV3]MPT55353.1 amidohydrolase [Alcaligenaceae bacterium]